VDLSYLPLSPRRKSSGKGTYYCLEYDIILLFGLTELEAMVAWKEEVGPLLVLFLTSLFRNFLRVLNGGVQLGLYMIQIP